ncbi:MAG: hypothetical protein SGI74_04095 [Oligoflexia bacterium]|nr:hypothetical protein [Oligoflexia bacterium]
MSDLKRSTLLFMTRSGTFGSTEQILNHGGKISDPHWVYSWLLVVALAGVICIHTGLFF